MGVTDCDNMLMLLGVSNKMTETERDIVVPMMMRGFKVRFSQIKRKLPIWIIWLCHFHLLWFFISTCVYETPDKPLLGSCMAIEMITINM